ncbi:MAG: undecaprenyl-diphosphate phosphatase [Gemmataceae bacterium]|nr:undecaprenyl-diphosphate phosphatase [Gemmataceae bacterium]
MSLLDAVLLGALQGITEFLPISSSGHLVLAQHFLGVTDDTGAKEIFFDGMLHLGTLLAVLAYFFQDVRRQMRQVLTSPAEEKPWPHTWSHLFHLGVLVGLATLPAVAAAILLDEHIRESFKRADVVAVNFFFLGIILVATDVMGRRRPGTTVGPATTWWQALLVGAGQAVSAAFRGLSRSGMTICTALLVGMERNWAVRFSFMMSVVASLGLGLLGIRKALSDANRSQWLTPDFLAVTLVGVLVSAVVGYLTITPLIYLVRRCRLWWFAVYVWLVGGAVLIMLARSP